jgi:hypothetical protein
MKRETKNEKRTTTAAVAFLVMLALPATSSAWGEKGHFIVNEAATLSLPNDMPHFFYRSFAELVWLSYDPDRWKGAGLSIDAVNNPDHFLDYEFVVGLELPRSRYEFLALMESSGRLRKHGIGNDTTGFVPWRVAELSEQLTGQFRQWRFSAPGSAERQHLERDIIHTAGILGHYVGDSANPHHATMHYNGWASAENPNRYATDCGTHSRFESVFVAHALTVDHVTPKVAAPVLRTDYFATAVDFIKSSNALTETIYRLDREAEFNIFKKDLTVGTGFASDRLAAGASMLRDIWWSAWQNSARSPRRRSSDD